MFAKQVPQQTVSVEPQTSLEGLFKVLAQRNANIKKKLLTSQNVSDNKKLTTGQELFMKLLKGGK